MPTPKIGAAAPRATTPKSPSLATFAKENAKLIAKTDGRDQLGQLVKIALMLKYEGNLSADGKKLLGMVRKATPKQAEVLHALLHQRKWGGDYKPPAAQADLAKKATPLLAHLQTDDLDGLTLMALEQKYRGGSPAGLELFDRLRTATPQQVEVLHKQLNERVNGKPSPNAGWSPRTDS